MNTKLSKQQRQDIVKRALSGEFLSMLAREFGVSRDCIYTIVRSSRRAESV